MPKRWPLDKMKSGRGGSKAGALVNLPIDGSTPSRVAKDLESGVWK